MNCVWEDSLTAWVTATWQQGPLCLLPSSGACPSQRRRRVRRGGEVEEKEKASVIAPNEPNRRSHSVHVHLRVCGSCVLSAELRRVPEIGAKVRTDSKRGHGAEAATGRVAFHIPRAVTQQHARRCPSGVSAEVATVEEPECDIFFPLHGRSDVRGARRRLPWMVTADGFNPGRSHLHSSCPAATGGR